MHRIVAMVFAPLKRNGQIFVEDLTNIFCTKFGLVISDEMIFKVYSIFSFVCMFCRSLFVLLCFFVWPLCCLFFFDIRILITPL
jgi:hypothetical protein